MACTDVLEIEMHETDKYHKPDTWLQIIPANTVQGMDPGSDQDDLADKSIRKQCLKSSFKEVYSKVYYHSFNPCTLQFESQSCEPSGNSGLVQCARSANTLELTRMFGIIPSSLCFKDKLVTKEDLHAARKSLQQYSDDFHFFEDTEDQHTGNKSNKENLPSNRNGGMQFIKSLNIPAPITGRSRPKEGILFPNSILELRLNKNKCLALPPLCSRGARNWMNSIVQAELTRKRVAQLIGYQNKLSHLVNDRWFKVIKTAIFMEKSFERQWNVLGQYFDPNEGFSEFSKWSARCTLAYVQDHMYALLRELVYLFERVSYKNSFSNTEASKADMLFKCLEQDASLLPYPIRPLTAQEEGKEVCKLCREAMQSGCSPYRRFISPKWVETGVV